MKGTLLLLFSCFASGLFAQQFELISDNGTEINIRHNFLELPVSLSQIDGQQFSDFSKTYKVVTMEEGAPALPLFHTTVQLPARGASSLEVVYSEMTEYTNVNVAPSKGNLKRNIDPSTVTYRFGDAYGRNEFYPQQTASLNEPFIWRSSRGQTITLAPVQYNPVTKVLRVYGKMEVRLIVQPQLPGINELGKVAPERIIKNSQERFYINKSQEKYVPIEEEGEMLVIAGPDFVEEMTPFVNWKNQKGIRTTLVTTTETGATATGVRDYIASFYASHPDLIYVLLAGDHADIPAFTYGMPSNEELWSDSWFGQLSGTDYYPEVFVGRFSGNEAQIAMMVNRTLEYEKNPAPGDWMEKAIGLGSNEGAGIGNDGEPDWQHLRNIRGRLMDYGYTTVSEFYDGSHGENDATGSPLTADIRTAVNGGVGLFNYTGHGDLNTCITGNFKSADIDAATNNGMYPLVVSVACNNGTFTWGTCISERWMRADNNASPAGAIGAAGSTILMAWAQPMQTQDEMTEIIAEAYPTNKKTTLGGLFYNGQMSMLEEYPAGDGIEVMQTWVFFGDPSTQFRNKQTMNLEVLHVPVISTETTELAVNTNVDGALVAISKENVLLSAGTTVGGTVTLDFPALTPGDSILVTVTKQNHEIYQAYIGTGESLAAGQLMIYPNPTPGTLKLIKSKVIIERAEIYSPAGQIVMRVEGKGNDLLDLDVHTLTPGAYLLKVISADGVEVHRVQVL